MESRFNIESYLLGLSMAALYAVKEELIQGHNVQALGTLNRAIKRLENDIDKNYYDKREPNGEENLQGQEHCGAAPGTPKDEVTNLAS